VARDISLIVLPVVGGCGECVARTLCLPPGRRILTACTFRRPRSVVCVNIVDREEGSEAIRLLCGSVLARFTVKSSLGAVERRLSGMELRSCATQTIAFSVDIV